ncbi:hypothetical protein BDW02DRAFT_602763 [Decorospora gaudefroyi]|uniref:RING-type domain-containing protein n=1 Tax=Decorospora gaudefroyi TaxID=184978 RepID=A0A6A5K754_9PLEO|nr:hypothetical protein BDW02DRAFT_602763 [Decorospora gaudefroyi]
MAPQLPSKVSFLAGISTIPTSAGDRFCGICRKTFGQKYTEHPDHSAFRISKECSHTYHRRCIIEWLAKNNICPADAYHHLYQCVCIYCQINERLDVYAQTPNLASVAQEHLNNREDEDRYCNAIEDISEKLKRVVEQSNNGDIMWLSEQAIAASLATSYMKQCSHNLSMSDFGSLCAYRREKLVELEQQDATDPQPVNKIELHFVMHNSMVDYTIDIPKLFKHDVSEYVTCYQLVTRSNPNTEVTFVALPYPQDTQFKHPVSGYAYITMTPDLKMIIKEKHPGWIFDVEVDVQEETQEPTAVEGLDTEEDSSKHAAVDNASENDGNSVTDGTNEQEQASIGGTDTENAEEKTGSEGDSTQQTGSENGGSSQDGIWKGRLRKRKAAADGGGSGRPAKK